MLIPIKATIILDEKSNLITQHYDYFDLDKNKELKDKVLQALCDKLLKYEEVSKNEEYGKRYRN